MALSGFSVVHARTDAEEHSIDAPLIYCFDQRQLVLAFISRTALADFFHLSQRPTMRESNLIADRNIDAFARIVTAKYEAGETTVYDSFGRKTSRELT